MYIVEAMELKLRCTRGDLRLTIKHADATQGLESLPMLREPGQQPGTIHRTYWRPLQKVERASQEVLNLIISTAWT